MQRIVKARTPKIDKNPTERMKCLNLKTHPIGRGIVLRMDIGIIFDWDGVVVDSSAAHEESWERLARAEKRVLPPDHFKRGFGRKNTVIIPEILGWAHEPAEIRRLSLQKEYLYREILKEKPPVALPGVRALLHSLKTRGVLAVVGSSTDRANILTCMDALDLHAYFADIVSAEDVTHGKPHPEVFVKAAARIDRLPAHCAVLEDSFAGLEAARAGGMKAIGVATTHPLESLRGKADLAVRRLTDLSFEAVEALLRA